jgi:hypothetical protein
VHVRSIGMPFAVIEVAVLLGRPRRGYLGRSVSRNVLTTPTDFGTSAAFTSMLSYS